MAEPDVVTRNRMSNRTKSLLVGSVGAFRRAQWEKLLQPVPLIPLLIIIGFVALAMFGHWIAPFAPETIDLRARLQPPFWLNGGDPGHLLGTDRLGRDILSRLIIGARVSLAVSAVAILIGGTTGTVLGLYAGYKGGWADAIIMRATDFALGLPVVILALVVAAALGASFINLIFVLSFLVWSRYSRLIRGEVLRLRERDYVKLAELAGASTRRILVRHLFPNVLDTLLVLVTLQAGWVIIVEASLSFLGAGVPPPTPSWGLMAAEGRNYITSAWWLSLFPGIMILLVVFSFNMLGDWIRDVSDPRLQ